MYSLYNVCMFFYFLVTGPYYLFHILTREHYRAGLKQRLGFVSRPKDIPDKPLKIWFHGVSVGEIQVLLGLGGKLEEALPLVHPVYSTTTLAAQRLAAGRLGKTADLIYFPLDAPFAVRRALARVNPALVVLAETELWPNFLRRCHALKIPVMLVNGRISKRSFGGYRLIRKFTRIFLPWIEQCLMQDQAYADRIVALGAPADRVRVTGNMKADAQSPSQTPGAHQGLRELQQIFLGWRLTPGTQILVAGSTHPGEEEILGKLFLDWKAKIPNLVLVMAPRHLTRVDAVVHALQNLGLRVARRSQARKESGPQDVEVFLLDTLGELAFVYAWADLVFVGKSLCAHGGQNPIEPARLGRPVLFGPHMENFSREAGALLGAGGAVEVADENHLRAAVMDLLRSPEKMRAMGQSAQRAVESLRGAMGENLRILQDRISHLEMAHPPAHCGQPASSHGH